MPIISFSRIQIQFSRIVPNEHMYFITYSVNASLLRNADVLEALYCENIVYNIDQPAAVTWILFSILQF